jgi:hypothetical protein
MKSPPQNVSKKASYGQIKSSGYGGARPTSAVKGGPTGLKSNENKNTKNM